MAFKDQVVWITGASSGIGEALTYALHKEGANIIISSRRTEELERVKANCNRSDSNIHILPLDLNDKAHISEKGDEALKLYGHIDYLFNNGGVSPRSLAVETDMKVVRKVMEVNFFGAVALTHKVLPSIDKA